MPSLSRCIDGLAVIADGRGMIFGPRRQIIDLGGFQAVKIGAPSAFSDLYYLMMEFSWPAFAGFVASVFLGVNVFFGAIYAAMPGAIINAEAGSFLDGFFFSVETLATVGYGNMAPATHLGHSIATTEIMLGLFLSSAVTGLIFARFARPRQGILFSRVAVVGRYEGRPALMVRLASLRSRPLSEVTAQLAFLDRIEMADGRFFRRLIDLPLVRARNPLFALSWTLVHLLDEDSPVLRSLQSEDRFNLTAVVSGIDTLLANQTQGGRTYGRDDVLLDHDFVDVIRDHEGSLEMDLARLHDVTPMAPEVVAAKQPGRPRGRATAPKP